MKLLINPEGGMAGDMFTAALVSAGADFKVMQKAILAAGQRLGNAQVDIKQAPDGASQLAIRLEPAKHHLGEHEARKILHDLFNRLDIREKYRDWGMSILEILVKAEKRAHAQYHIVIEEDHGHDGFHHHPTHSHDHEHEHDHNHNHNHNHSHTHSHSHNHNHDHDHEHDHSHSHPHSHTPPPHSHPSDHDQAFLHEAQDIVMDIIGAVTGMQWLDIEPAAELLGPVSVGGGQVRFSHGTHSIPAPATAIMLEEYHIPWKKGPLEVELFTPTGAAILAALGSPLNSSINLETLEGVSVGKARGSKILDIPPLEVYIYASGGQGA